MIKPRLTLAILGALLDGLPGVANAGFSPGVGRPTIRGQQGSRVKVLEDSLGKADASGEGADHAIAIDPARAEQIEVLRGSSTLAYGSGAAGGVVNDARFGELDISADYRRVFKQNRTGDA